MSVINQMLKDLEARRSVSEHGRYISPASKREVSWLIWLPVSLLLGIAVGLIFWLQIRSTERVVDPVSVAAPPTHITSATAAVSSAVIASREKEPTKTLLAAGADHSTAANTVSGVASGSTSQALALSSGAAETKSDEAVMEESLIAQDDSQKGGVEDGSVKEASDEVVAADSANMEEPLPVEESVIPAAPPQDQLQIDEVTLSADDEAALQRKQAEQAMDRGNLPKAREAFYALLQAKPTDTQAREKLAALLFGAGDVAGARSLLEQGIALTPDYANFRLLSARMDMSNGQKSRALTTLRGCEPDVGKNMDFYATRAALAQELGDYSLSANSYQKLTFRQPAEGRWWMGLAISYEKSGRPQAALDAYRHAQAAAGLSANSLEFVRQRLARLEHTP